VYAFGVVAAAVALDMVLSTIIMGLAVVEEAVAQEQV
jgi:hypothetical protein